MLSDSDACAWAVFFYATLCAESRSRRARAPWLVRSADIFCSAFAPSAQA